jgi:exopolyphosphatase/guanosine-5'-triphosphate,3'-diphosphate pyrophosphatase
MARAKRDEPPLQQVSGATVSAEDVHRVVRALTKASTADERLAVPGLDPRRVDIIVGGALILEEAVSSLGIGELIVSDFALREGLLLDSIRRRDSTSIGHLRDLRYESVLHLAAITPGERDHANHATELALQLFEHTRSLHGLGGEAEEILEAAGLLANVGLFVAHDRHHLHSYYIIRHSDLLTGFTDHEVELIALVARYHRKSAPKPTHAEFASLSPADQQLVRVLAGILRLGFALDRTRAGAVKAVKASVTPGRKPQLVLDLVAGGDDVELERYTSEERKSLLESALGVPVVLAPA